MSDLNQMMSNLVKETAAQPTESVQASSETVAPVAEVAAAETPAAPAAETPTAQSTEQNSKAPTLTLNRHRQLLSEHKRNADAAVADLRTKLEAAEAKLAQAASPAAAAAATQVVEETEAGLWAALEADGDEVNPLLKQAIDKLEAKYEKKMADLEARLTPIQKQHLEGVNRQENAAYDAIAGSIVQEFADIGLTNRHIDHFVASLDKDTPDVEGVVRAHFADMRESFASAGWAKQAAAPAAQRQAPMPRVDGPSTAAPSKDEPEFKSFADSMKHLSQPGVISQLRH